MILNKIQKTPPALAFGESRWRAGKDKILIAALIFIPAYSLYLFTAPGTVYWQDSGIFLAGVKTFGVMFPPGFPLYILLGQIWIKLLSLLPSGLNFARQVHAFSSLWGAGTGAVIGLTVYEIVAKSKWRIPVSVIAGLTAVFSYSLWAQSINAEIYSMAAFFSALLYFAAVKIILLESGDHKTIQKWLFILVLVWGLSFSAHLATIAFAPALLYLIFSQSLSPFFATKTFRLIADEKVWEKIIPLFVAGALIPYLYLPIRSAAQPALLWAKIDSVQTFTNHLSGRDYRLSDQAFGLDWDKIKGYPVLFYQEFYIAGIILGILGCWQLWKNRQTRPFLYFGLIFAVSNYLLISFYERGTEYNFWLIPVYLWWSICIGLGLFKLLKLLKSLKLLRIFEACIIFAASVCLFYPQISVNWPLLNRSRYTLASEFGKNLIGHLPPDSIFFTVGDQESAIPMYLQLVEGFRKDVVVLSDSDLITDWKRTYLLSRYPELTIPQNEDPVAQVNEFILANLDKHRIFLITKKVIPISDQFNLIPSGTFWEVQTGNNYAINLSFWDYRFSDPDRYNRPARPELSRKTTKDGRPAQIRLPFFDEARAFELQGKKNLGDVCFNTLSARQTLAVITTDSKKEIWDQTQLSKCAINAYEDMFKLQPGFHNDEIASRLAILEKTK